MSKRRAALAALPLAALLALTGCGGEEKKADTPAASAEMTNPVADESSATTGNGGEQSSAPAGNGGAVATGDLKKAATAKLPAKVLDFTGKPSESEVASVGMYTKADSSQMFMASLNRKLPYQDTMKQVLEGIKEEGNTICGMIQGTGPMCIVPLDGGHLQVTGAKQKPEELAKYAQALYDSLA